MSQLRKSSSAASQPHQINVINYLRGELLVALVSLILPDICDGRPHWTILPYEMLDIGPRSSPVRSWTSVADGFHDCGT